VRAFRVTDPTRSLLVRTLLITAGAVLFAVSTEGPDFGHYIDWAGAALDRDIFDLRGDILSPAGVPFTLWSFEPGLLFALGMRATSRVLSSTEAAYLTGWSAAMVFWGAAVVVFRKQIEGQRIHDTVATLITVLAATFIGTHAGFYSHSYATEVFGLSLVAALWAFSVWRRPWLALDALVAGVLIGLLFLVRPYLIVYALPPVCIGMSVERGSLDVREPGRPVRILLLALPILVAASQYLLVNRWMTGSAWQPPYVFGGSGFTSMDLLHPEFAAVLAHSWHGLLAYHPLYGVAFIALLVRLWSDPRDRVLWGTSLVAVVMHLWLQSAWFAWWLGTSTFGMRGLAPAAVPLMAALAATLHRNPRLWTPIVVVACLWSFTLMLDGPTQYATWRELLRAQRWALASMGVAIVATPFLGSTRFAAGVLSLLVAAYLASRLVQLTGNAHTMAMVFIAAALLVALLGVMRRVSAAAILAIAALIVFIGQGVLFARLAITTERHVVSGAAPPREFRYRSAAPVDELRDTYREYLSIGGFEPKKAQLRHFLDQQAIDAPILSAADRDIVRRIRTAFAADPLIGNTAVYVTATAGVVRLESDDANRERHIRAVAVAQNAAGVVRVDDYMR
jgi:hypothetical protein